MIENIIFILLSLGFVWLVKDAIFGSGNNEPWVEKGSQLYQKELDETLQTLKEKRIKALGHDI